MNVSQIRQLVLDGQLTNAEKIDATIVDWQADGGSADDGPGLVARLIERQLLTDFQGQALLKNVTGPHKLGPYRVFDQVAAGRLGNVFRAVHEEFNQPVSLKIFPPSLLQDPERATRLARETRVALQVDHPNVVRTYQVGKVGDAIFLAIEDLQGHTLAELLEQEGKLSIYAACNLVREAALGLAHLHSLEIIHRDVQPGTLWVTSDQHCKLMEFGTARDALAFLDVQDEGGAVTLSDELLGTYDYMAPEQAAGEQYADTRSDIYSLGCVLFHCLTGEVAYPDRNPVRKMMRHAREPLRNVSAINSEVPQSIADVVATMLAKDPDARYQKAEDVAWALENLIATEELVVVKATDINPDFLEWAKENTDASNVVADREFIDFLGWMADREEDEEAEQSQRAAFF